MARPFEGKEHLEAERALKDKAKTMQDHRQALAVLLALERPLSLEETAELLGMSKGSTSRIRH
jgi:predicted HTH domain antitoxin